FLLRSSAIRRSALSVEGVLPKWHGPFQARFTHSVIPSEVEESLILTITSSKRCLDCARHDKKPICATRPPHSIFARAKAQLAGYQLSVGCRTAASTHRGFMQSERESRKSCQKTTAHQKD